MEKSKSTTTGGGKTSTTQGKNEKETSDSKLISLDNMIKDIFYSQVKKNELTKKIREYGFSNKNKVVPPSYIILPFSYRKILWDIFLSIIICYQLFIIPIDLGFNMECVSDDDGLNSLQTISRFFFVIYSIDIGFNFITALQNSKGEYEYNIKQIAVKYIQSNFIIDVAALIPFESIIPYDNSICWTGNYSFNKTMSLIKFLRLNKLVKFTEILEKRIPAALVGYFRILKICIIYYYVCHFIGNIFTGNSITLLKIIKESNQVYTKDFNGFIKIYSFSIFIGMYLVIGNDIALETSHERIFVIVINIVTLILNAYTFGTMAISLKSSAIGGDSTLSERLDKINDFINFLGINIEFRLEINSFYQFMFKRQRNLLDSKDIFVDLSNSLKIACKYHYWRKNYFAVDKLFSENSFSSEFLFNSLKLMNSKMVAKGEKLIYEGEYDLDLYFVTTGGKFSVLIHGNVVNILKEGDYFGEIALFLRTERRSATVISIETSDVLYIKGVDFKKLMMNNQKESEIMKEMSISKFNKSIQMTKVCLASQLFKIEDYLAIFKKDLYTPSTYTTKDINNHLKANNVDILSDIRIN